MAFLENPVVNTLKDPFTFSLSLIKLKELDIGKQFPEVKQLGNLKIHDTKIFVYTDDVCCCLH